MSVLVVSPHLDDAVLSCGQLLATHPGSKIVTVMAGIPDSDLPLTKYDVDSGFTSARQAVTERRHEDVRACAVLDARYVHLRAYDRQYGIDTELDPIIEALTTEMAGFTDDEIYVPLGLLHPDHEIVGRCARVAARKQGHGRVQVYGELPGWVIQPLVLEPTMNRVRTDESWRLESAPDLTERARLDQKRAAAGCYQSQAWAIPAEHYLVPELFWRATFIDVKIHVPTKKA